MFSRSENSVVLTAASTAGCSNPTSARRASSPRMSASTFSASPGATPLSPTEKTGCLSSSWSPPPISASPSPESLSALRSGAAAVPRSR